MSDQAALFNDPDDLPAPSCVLSDCGRYRYELRLPLAAGYPRVCLFVLANPSTAVAVGGYFKSDPTVTRCIDYATAWGFTELVVCNVRAWRETNPRLVPPDPLAIGPENDSYLRENADAADITVCGWGKLGGDRGREVLGMLREVGQPCALKLNESDGSPAHPLYLAKALQPFVIREAANV
jgi:hypothetical protein